MSSEYVPNVSSTLQLSKFELRHKRLSLIKIGFDDSTVKPISIFCFMWGRPILPVSI